MEVLQVVVVQLFLNAHLLVLVVGDFYILFHVVKVYSFIFLLRCLIEVRTSGSMLVPFSPFFAS